MKKELMRLEAEIRVVCLKTEKRAAHQVVAMATRSKKKGKGMDYRLTASRRDQGGQHRDFSRVKLILHL